MGTDEKLGRLATDLQARGAEELRVETVRRARDFKRSWIRMAEALVQVRDGEAYRGWGYHDFYDYCANELLIRRATADKLTGSFVALQRHAPAVLRRDGLTERVPTCDAVDYFARALQKGSGTDGPADRGIAEEAVQELTHAVFEEGAPVTELRKRFNPVFHPKPEGVEQIELIRRATATARKLERMIDDIDGLPRRVVRDGHASLEALKDELTALLERTKATYAEAG